METMQSNSLLKELKISNCWAIILRVSCWVLACFSRGSRPWSCGAAFGSHVQLVEIQVIFYLVLEKTERDKKLSTLKQHFVRLVLQTQTVQFNLYFKILGITDKSNKSQSQNWNCFSFIFREKKYIWPGIKGDINFLYILCYLALRTWIPAEISVDSV